MFEGLKILYLEDEPLVALDTSEHLETLGFDEIAVTYRLDAAQAKAAATAYDIALLDINVDKGQTSLELGDHLLAKGTRVIFASGNGIDAPELRAKGFGFLDKPFALSALTGKLQEYTAKE